MATAFTENDEFWVEGHTIFANPRVYFTFRVVSMGRCAFHFVCGGIMISRAGTSISCDWRKVNTVCATVMHCLVLSRDLQPIRSFKSVT